MDLKQWYDRFVTNNASKSILDEEEIESAEDLLLADQKTLDLLSQSRKVTLAKVEYDKRWVFLKEDEAAPAIALTGPA